MWLTKCLFARTRKNIIIQSANTTTIYFCLPAKWETEIDIFSCSLVLHMIRNNKIYHYQNLPIGFARIPFLNFIILWLNFFHKQTRLNFISWFPGWAGRDRISLSNYEFVQVLWLEYLHSWTQKKKILLGVNRMLYENGITALLSNWWMLNDYSAKLLFLVGNYYMDKFCGKL